MRFDSDEADRVVEFFETVLVHTNDLWAGNPFVLADWQREEIIRPLYGWQQWSDQYECWVRRYTTAWVELGRGNGKSELAAGCTALALVADGLVGGEVYGAAEDIDGADIIFRIVKDMFLLSPVLSPMVDEGRIQIVESRRRIIDQDTKSFYRALPRDESGDGSQGFRPATVVFDEYHTQKTAALKSALKRGMGKGLQPLFLFITTAGNDLTRPAWEEHEYSRRVLDGEVDDPHRFVFMRNMPRDADPFDEANWYHPNPALGDFLSIATLREEAQEAREKPTEENSFRQFRGNQWVNQRTRWMPMHRYDRCGKLAGINEADLFGRTVYGGLDLASTTDIAALNWDFKQDDGKHLWLPRFWVPEAMVAAHDKATGGHFSVWVREGFVNVTEGDAIDTDEIFNTIVADAKRFQVERIKVDPHQAIWLIAKLKEELGQDGNGEDRVLQHSQTATHMNAPTRETERLIWDEQVEHAGNPVLRWMFDNVTIKRDGDENIRPDRKKSTGKIDGAVAAIMSVGASFVPPAEEYEAVAIVLRGGNA